MGMDGKNTIDNRWKEGVKNAENRRVLCRRKRMDTLSFLQMQNKDKNKGRHFVEKFPHLLSEMQTGMFDRC